MDLQKFEIRQSGDWRSQEFYRRPLGARTGIAFAGDALANLISWTQSVSQGLDVAAECNDCEP